MTGFWTRVASEWWCNGSLVEVGLQEIKMTLLGSFPPKIRSLFSRTVMWSNDRTCNTYISPDRKILLYHNECPQVVRFLCLFVFCIPLAIFYFLLLPGKLAKKVTFLLYFTFLLFISGYCSWLKVHMGLAVMNMVRVTCWKHSLWLKSTIFYRLHNLILID